MSTLPAHRVAVVGGGPAGLATALGLLSDGCDVTVIERADYGGVRVGEHLPPTATSSLRQLHVPDRVFRGGHHPCHGVRSAWGEGRLVDSSYLFSPDGDGVNLSRPGFDAALADLARQRGAHILMNTRVRRIARWEDGWNLELSTLIGSSRLSADFLVDASGRTAAAARMLGRRVIVCDRLVGLIGFLLPAEAPGGETDESLLLEAVEHGWWYVSHLGDGRAVGAYMTDSGLELGRPLEMWRERLAETTFVKARLRGFCPLDRVEVRSARSQRLDRTAGAGWLAVGDAAMSFDPLSSQGIAKGLNDGIRAARAIRDHFTGNAPVPARWDVERNRAFREYLQTRADYYRMEARWPGSSFWCRRQEALPWELPITLDPRAVLCASPQALARSTRDELERLAPGIDFDLLCELARSPRPAHRVVSSYQTRTERWQADRDVICSLQQLIARDTVGVVDG